MDAGHLGVTSSSATCQLAASVSSPMNEVGVALRVPEHSAPGSEQIQVNFSWCHCYILLAPDHRSCRCLSWGNQWRTAGTGLRLGRELRPRGAEARKGAGNAVFKEQKPILLIQTKCSRCASKRRRQGENLQTAAAVQIWRRSTTQPAARRRGPGCWQQPEAEHLCRARRDHPKSARPTTPLCPRFRPYFSVPRPLSSRANPAVVGEDHCQLPAPGLRGSGEPLSLG